VGTGSIPFVHNIFPVLSCSVLDRHRFHFPVDAGPDPNLYQNDADPRGGSYPKFYAC
jgi:hypothetical protein